MNRNPRKSRFSKLVEGFQAGALYLAFLMMGMAVGVLLLAYVLAGEIYDYQDTVDGVHLPKVDAIVCLAGGRGRIAAAGDIWYRYWELDQAIVKDAGKAPIPSHPPILYLSGMGRQSTWAVLTLQLRRGVLQAIHPENVILETESSNTEENARFVNRFVEQRGWERILLITSPYHMKRAKSIFERVFRASGKNVEIETFSVFQEPFEPGEWRGGLHGIRVTVMEYFKWLYYKFVWKPDLPMSETRTVTPL